MAVILNIDLDHVDYFKSIDQMIDSFHRSIREAAVAVANFEDENVRLAVRAMKENLVSAGISAPDALYRAEKIEPFAGGSRFLLTRGGQALCTVTLKLPGRHNVLDAGLRRSGGNRERLHARRRCPRVLPPFTAQSGGLNTRAASAAPCFTTTTPTIPPKFRRP